MKKSALVFAVLLFLSGMVSSQALAAGAAVDSENLQITLPHVEYAGQRFHLVLDFAGNLGDGFYWKYNSLYPTTVTGQCGGSVDGSLNITEICALLDGKEYKISLEFRQDPAGHQGLYWKLGSAQPQQCTISRISGGGPECDQDLTNEIQQCVLGCGVDIACLEACSELIAFSLSIEYTNSTSSAQDCVVPPGTVFRPEDLSFQPMLLVRKEAFHVPAGSTQSFCVTTFCMDSGLSIPDETNPYHSEGGAVTSCMVEIVKNIFGKTLGGNTGEVQNIVWDCTDTGTISDAQRAFLQSL